MRDGISTTTSVDPVDTEREIEESVQEPLIIKEKLPWQENVESEADTSLQHILNKFSEMQIRTSSAGDQRYLSPLSASSDSFTTLYNCIQGYGTRLQAKEVGAQRKRRRVTQASRRIRSVNSTSTNEVIIYTEEAFAEDLIDDEPRRRA